MDKVGIYAYDYGGAFNLFLYLKKKNIINHNKNILFFIFGPAKKCINILDKKCKFQKNLKQLKECKILYYSLSHKKHFEKNVISIIKRKKIYSVLIIDGWGNYKKKMTIKNKIFMPDEVIILDKMALKIFKTFSFSKNILIKHEKNLLFGYLKKSYEKQMLNKNQILYLSSPVHKLNQIEKKILKKFSLLHKLKLKIRLHPSERKKEYGNNIIQELKYSKIIIGHNSSALIYSSVLNKQTYTVVKGDLYNWKKYGIYRFFRINKIKHFKDLLNGAGKQKKL